MAHFNYLIVGGGMTADAAARSIHAVDETGAIGSHRRGTGSALQSSAVVQGPVEG